MLTKKAKWILYTASYCPLYFLLTLRLLFDDDIGNKVTFKQRVLYNWEQYLPVIILLLFLFFLSAFVVYKTSSINSNERIYKKLVKNATGEMATFFIPFILSFLTISMDWYGGMISMFIFFLCGYIIIQADWLHICPVFFYSGYRLYKEENGKYVLTRLKKEQFNQLLLENSNGIEVKALTPNFYVTIQNKF